MTDPEKTQTMLRGKTDAETCRLNGWGVGTQLEGDEGYGPTVIQITAVGERELLAKRISHRGEPEQRPREGNWTLECRNWRKVGDATAEAKCVCGAPDAYSLNPAEVLVHSVDIPCYIAEAQR